MQKIITLLPISSQVRHIFEVPDIDSLSDAGILVVGIRGGAHSWLSDNSYVS
jgi:hypothetical protein